MAERDVIEEQDYRGNILWLGLSAVIIAIVLSLNRHADTRCRAAGWDTGRLSIPNLGAVCVNLDQAGEETTQPLRDIPN